MGLPDIREHKRAAATEPSHPTTSQAWDTRPTPSSIGPHVITNVTGLDSNSRAHRGEKPSAPTCPTPLAAIKISFLAAPNNQAATKRTD